MNPAPTNPVLALNVPELLENVPHMRPGAPLLPLLLAIVMVSAMLMAGGSPWMAALVPLLAAGLIVLTFLRASRTATQQRQEQQAVRVIDEGIRLGRWEDAGRMLVEVLGNPGQRPHVRVQSLIYLGSVLSYENRFEDVDRVYSFLLQNAQLPPQIGISLRCAKAYALLREDRLADAYETISQLKRESQGSNSATVALLEVYQQVKTGHYEEALELFEQKRTAFAGQLGHRSGDAWALAAKAALGLGRGDTARLYAGNARLLASSAIISRRFPECVDVLEMAGAEGQEGQEGREGREAVAPGGQGVGS